jgi:lysozyme
MSDIKGIDVSEWNGLLKLDEIAAAGMKFIIARSTIGSGGLDRRWEQNRAMIARDGRFKFGTYHLVKPDRDPVEQADHFVKHVMDDERRPTMLALDVEMDMKSPPSKTYITTHLVTVIGRLAEHGIDPVIYTGRWYWGAYIKPISYDFTRHKLWVASYTAKPLLPGSWKSCAMWQYTSTFRIGRIRFDANYLYDEGLFK